MPFAVLFTAEWMVPRSCQVAVAAPLEAYLTAHLESSTVIEERKEREPMEPWMVRVASELEFYSRSTSAESIER